MTAALAEPGHAHIQTQSFPGLAMRHPIDPKVDCVFKALLGSEENRDLLIHFLNAMLVADLPGPIVDVEIIDAHNGQETRDDKLSIVDVKARDSHDQLYQIEVQMHRLTGTCPNASPTPAGQSRYASLSPLSLWERVRVRVIK